VSVACWALPSRSGAENGCVCYTWLIDTQKLGQMLLHSIRELVVEFRINVWTFALRLARYLASSSWGHLCQRFLGKYFQTHEAKYAKITSFFTRASFHACKSLCYLSVTFTFLVTKSERKPILAVFRIALLLHIPVCHAAWFSLVTQCVHLAKATRSTSALHVLRNFPTIMSPSVV
jgi:hypothetical protein